MVVAISRRQDPRPNNNPDLAMVVVTSHGQDLKSNNNLDLAMVVATSRRQDLKSINNLDLATVKDILYSRIIRRQSATRVTKTSRTLLPEVQDQRFVRLVSLVSMSDSYRLRLNDFRIHNPIKHHQAQALIAEPKLAFPRYLPAKSNSVGRDSNNRPGTEKVFRNYFSERA